MMMIKKVPTTIVITEIKASNSSNYSQFTVVVKQQYNRVFMMITTGIQMQYYR